MQLTDEEIIKALECCSSSIPICEKCCFNKQCNDGENILPTILDLVNRQKAEIERLTNNVQLEVSKKIEQKIKSEAYKEFAERLLEICSKDLTISNDSYSLIEENIKIIQKEMVGDDE